MLFNLKGTNDISSDSTIVSSLVYSIFNHLIEHLKLSLKNQTLSPIKGLISEMASKIEIYWNSMKDDALIAHVLDPRFKLILIDGSSKKKIAIEKVENVYENYKNIADSRTNIQRAEKKRSKSLIERLVAKINSTDQTNTDEIERFFHQPTIGFSKDANILNWWQENSKDFPVLANVARDFLSMMPTSVSSERVFSIGGMTVTKNRTKLHSNTVQELLCLRSWISNNISE